ncbi:hypothetical protein ES703_77703 [subsurface metagenome]
MAKFLGRKKILPAPCHLPWIIFLYGHAPSQHYWISAHGTRFQPYPAGYPDPLQKDAGIRSSMGSRDRPCGNSHPACGGKEPGQGGSEPRKTGKRGIHQEDMAMEGKIRRADFCSTEELGCLLQLEGQCLHHGFWPLSGCGGGIHSSIPGRIHLPGRLYHQLVPRMPDSPIGH